MVLSWLASPVLVMRRKQNILRLKSGQFCGDCCLNVIASTNDAMDSCSPHHVYAENTSWDFSVWSGYYAAVFLPETTEWWTDFLLLIFFFFLTLDYCLYLHGMPCAVLCYIWHSCLLFDSFLWEDDHIRKEEFRLCVSHVLLASHALHVLSNVWYLF